MEGMMDEHDDMSYRKTISIERVAREDRPGAPWALRFTSDDRHGWSQSNVEHMTQGELLDLWNAIGVLFNLAGMGEDITDDELRRRGIHIKTASRNSL